ncbi:MAG: OmpA family protein [Rikenellaceae bacterium]
MKKTLLLISCGFLFASCCGMRTLQRDAKITTNPVALELIADSYENPKVDIDYDVLVPKGMVKRREQIIYQPLFLTSTDNYLLTPVVINGKKMAKLEKKASDKGERLPYADAIRVEDKKSPMTINYNMSAPVSDWMPYSELVGWTMVNCGKRHKEVVIDRHVIASGITIPEKPEPEKPKTVTKEVTQDLDMSEITYFEINSAKYDATLDKNSATVGQLRKLLADINSDDNKTLTTIEVIGSASPEGTEKLNSKLALERANTIADMISEQLGVNKMLLRVSSKGANWQGFIEHVEASSLANKQAILTIAKSSKTDWQKTLELRKLSNYDILKKDYLPDLRKVRCVVNYREMTTVNENVMK